MAKFASEFPAGLESVVQDILRDELSNLDIKSVFDGLVIYITSTSKQDVKNLRFLTNSFLVFDEYDGSKQMEEIAHDFILNPPKMGRQGAYAKTFKVVVAEEGKIQPPNPTLLRSLEDTIKQVTLLRSSRDNPDLEFWLYKKRDYAFFGRRITKHPSLQSFLKENQISYVLANLMIRLSEPEKKDIFMDMYSGSESILNELLSQFSYRKIYALDSDKKTIKDIERKLGKKNNIHTEKGNPLNLKKRFNGIANKIVTVPYFSDKKKAELNKLYKQLLIQFTKSLKKNGIAVVLVRSKKDFEKVLYEQNKIKFIEKYNLPSEGKNSAIYKLRKV